MILYVNGIDTSLDEARQHKRAIGMHLNRTVALFYNPTAGKFQDLKESLWNKFMSWWGPSPIVQRAMEIILDRGATYLIGHSQGAMIILNALDNMTPAERLGIKCTLFASPKVDEFEGVDIEYFVNENDAVLAHIPNSSLMLCIRQNDSTFYVRPIGDQSPDDTGHSLIEEYLKHIEGFIGYEGSIFRQVIDDDGHL